ncbi:hypothetical protein [Amphibacillus xylanus]|nr:hypothetical protein [Amphibacillus xylanus]
MKVPYNARTGSRASSNDLSTFSSYEDVVKVMDDYTGIGFIVSHDICAVDLDDCVNEAGELNEIAQNIFAYFPNSYIEKSPCILSKATTSLRLKICKCLT